MPWIVKFSQEEILGLKYIENKFKFISEQRNENQYFFPTEVEKYIIVHIASEGIK